MIVAYTPNSLGIITEVYSGTKIMAKARGNTVAKP